ncbi:hypothetical protein Ms3S1_40990 [Methylosinus sp. 3S-1]
MPQEAAAVRQPFQGLPKMRALRPLAAIMLALSLAACAAQQQTDLTPPPKRALDAKTQLESGHQ